MKELTTKKLESNEFIVNALQNGVPVEALDKLLDMQERLYKSQAREEYFKALSKFQSECPIIKKTKSIKGKNGQIRSYYAPLEDIIEQVKPLLHENGLSYEIKSENDNGMVTATCFVHHIMGHTESSMFFSPIDPDAFMNDAQKYASANTYAKRNAFCNAFGIMTGDNDDDAQSLGGGVTAQDLYSRFRNTMDYVLNNYESIATIKAGISIGDYTMASQAWFELSEEEKRGIWCAWSKGGPFTTEECNVIKSSEFRKAFFGDKDVRDQQDS